jgi:hypothetical protein
MTMTEEARSRHDGPKRRSRTTKTQDILPLFCGYLAYQGGFH